MSGHPVEYFARRHQLLAHLLTGGISRPGAELPSPSDVALGCLDGQVLIVEHPAKRLTRVVQEFVNAQQAGNLDRALWSLRP